MNIDEIKKIASIKVIDPKKTSNLKPEEKLILKEAIEIIDIASKIDKISKEEQKDFIKRTNAIALGLMISSTIGGKGESGEPQNTEDGDYTKCVKSCLAIYESWPPQDRPYGFCALKCGIQALFDSLAM